MPKRIFNTEVTQGNNQNGGEHLFFPGVVENANNLYWGYPSLAQPKHE